MPVEVKREGHNCEKCKKSDTEVGKITHYTKHGDDLLLCPKCLEFRERPYTEKCPKCKRVAYEHGGMSAYGIGPSFENMCLECVEKREARDAKIIAIKSTIKNFAKGHWKFWITISISIIAIIIGLSRL